MLALLVMCIFLAVGLSLLVAIPLLLIKVALGLVLLPFRLLGGLVRLAFGLVASGVGVLFAIVGIVGGLVLLPLLPILFVGALLYGIVRLASRPARLRAVV